MPGLSHVMQPEPSPGVYVFDGHGLHEPPLIDVLPRTHGAHVPSAACSDSAAHCESVHDEWSDERTNSHGLHSTAPGESEYRRSPHIVHSVMPRTDCDLPAGQSGHDEAPSSPVALPAAHGRHDEAFAAGANVPGSHASHTVEA